MDVNELTAEELRKLADEKAQEGGHVIDVDGLIVHIDDAKAKSWKAFSLMAKMGDEISVDTLGMLLKYIEHVTDVDESAIVEHCGGDDATVEDVVYTITEIVKECYPKK